MAYAKVSMTNGVEVKLVPVGFSWTMFFWGFWPPIFRGDWIWAVCMFIACVFTYGLAGLVTSFFYNKSYMKSLFNKGYKVQVLPPNLTEEMLKNYLGYITLPMA